MTPAARTHRRRVTNAFVGVCAIVVALSFTLSTWTFLRQTQADTIRAADKKAQSVTQVGQCFTQVKSAPAVLTILDVINTLAKNSIQTSRSALKADADSPLAAVRKESLARIVPAQQDLDKYIIETKKTAKTVAICTALAKKLDVDPTQFNR